MTHFADFIHRHRFKSAPAPRLLACCGHPRVAMRTRRLSIWACGDSGYGRNNGAVAKSTTLQRAAIQPPKPAI
ncbi:MAG: hypothetical protein ACKN9T_04840 [Candidatus Methylumidiphilus sp.]